MQRMCDHHQANIPASTINEAVAISRQMLDLRARGISRDVVANFLVALSDYRGRNCCVAAAYARYLGMAAYRTILEER
jgi:hypothetical protein